MRSGGIAALLALLLLSPPPLLAQGTDDALARIKALRAQRPNDGLLAFYQAITHAGLGQKEAALTELASLQGRRLGLIPVAHTGFDKLWADADFQALRRRLADEEARSTPAPVAFTAPDARLIPEGIAYDIASNRFFLGSVAQRKIVAVAPASGQARDFSTAGDELDAVLGLVVDAPRRRLCAVSTNALAAGSDGDSNKPRRNRVLCYALDNGRLLQRHLVSGAAQLNDVTAAPDGTLYATDSEAGSLYRLRPGDLGFALMGSAGALRSANGVAVAPDGRAVYVALSTGVARVDAASGEMQRLPQPDSVVSGGIDGLYWWKGSLLGIQNAINPGRVVRLRLAADGRSIEGLQVLQSHHHPAFDEPTTGALVGDRFYVIANSFVSRVQPDGSLIEPASLRGAQVLRIDLQR